MWTSLLAVLVADMFGAFQGDVRGAAPLALLAGNAGFAGGLALASTVLPMSRAETWALDLGGAVGTLASAALAFGLRAPNPMLGYGAMALGCVGGLGAGLATARLVPPALAALPDVVALAPLTVPATGLGAPSVGVAVSGRF
jgi:hypothetical protein